MANVELKMPFSTRFLLLLLFLNSCTTQRIGSLFLPIHYDLVLLPIISGGNPRLCGHVFVDLQPKVTTNLLTFNANELSVLDVSVIEIAKDNSSTSNDQRLNRLEEFCFSGLFEEISGDVDVIQDEDEKQQISVIFKSPLFKNKQYRIGMFYVGKVRDKVAKGFFRVNYNNDDYSSCCHQGWFGGTQMEVAHARKVLPCWDEPAFKTTFDVTLGHERSLSAISNMPATSTNPMENTRDWVWTRFDRSPLMSTYLLAMFVTDYENVENIYKANNDRTVQMRFWGRPEQLPHLNQTMSVVAGMLNYLENYLLQPLALPKLDFISIPVSLEFVAMENWGAMLFSGENLYYDQNSDDDKKRFQVIQAAGHEMAHQFFGNLVTTTWWDDIWFYEGICGLFEFELVKQVAPELKFYAEQAWITSFQTAMKFEEQTKTAPVIRPAETIAEAEKLFDPIAYNKGHALLFMLRNFVGHERFRNAIITFMDRYRYQNARSETFMEILNEEIHRNRDVIGRAMNITTIMDSWTGQPSYPIVQCTRIANGRIRLSQMPHPGQLSPTENVTQLWSIPLAMTDGRRADFSPEGLRFPRVWLTPERPTLEIPYNFIPPENEDDWILINGEMSSYVRVLYDERNWRLLARQLMTDYTVIPQMTRAQLIDDAFTLAILGKLDYSIVFHLIEYLTVFKDEFVSSTTTFHVNWMEGRVMNSNETLYQLLKDYMAKLAFDKDKGLVRSGVRSDATLTIDEEKATMDHLCAVMRHGGQDEWEWAWQVSLSDDWVRKRTRILSVMSCSQDRNRIKKLLSRVFHPSIDQNPADTFAVLEKMTENPVAHSMAISFIKTNWEFLGRHFTRSGDRLKLLVLASKYLSTRQQLEEMSNFIRIQEKKGETLDRDVTTGILDGIHSNIRWMENHSDKVYSYLKDQTRRI